MAVPLHPDNPIQKMVEAKMAEEEWTQEVAATKLGIAISYVQQVLKGAVPGNDKLAAMAKGLGVDPGLLILMANRIKGGPEVQEALDGERLLEAMRAAHGSSDPTPPDWLPGKEEDEILLLMRGLSREEKKRVLAIVKAALGK